MHLACPCCRAGCPWFLPVVFFSCVVLLSRRPYFADQLGSMSNAVDMPLFGGSSAESHRANPRQCDGDFTMSFDPLIARLDDDDDLTSYLTETATASMRTTQSQSLSQRMGIDVPDLDVACADDDADSQCVTQTAARSLNVVLPEVYPGLHIGSYRDVCDARCIAEKNIGAFVCVADVSNPFPMVSDRALHVPVADDVTTNLADHTQRVAAFIDEALGAGVPVVIYCHQGVSRSAAFATAYVMRTCAIGAHEALAKVQRAYPRADPNFAFVQQLASSERGDCR